MTRFNGRAWVLGIAVVVSALLWGRSAAQSTPAIADLEKRLSGVEERLAEQDAGGSLRVLWKEGIRLESGDKTIKLKLGGRIMNDWAWFTNDDDVAAAAGENLVDGTELRRARLYLAGLLYERVEFKAQYDFAGGDVDFKDVYMGLTDLPYVGGLRVGHFKEPFSLEELTSSKYISFMERALPNAFSPGRNTGFMLHHVELEKRLTWAAGFFRDTDNFGDGSAQGDYNYTARVTCLPLYEEKGRKLIHVGAGYSRRNPNDETLSYDQSPESHLAPDLVDTGSFAADSLDLFGGEVAAVYGRCSLQGEYMLTRTHGSAGTDPDFHGFYLLGSVFLTGEHRPYKQALGAFGRLKPERNFPGEERALGAWELVGRFSSIDVNSGAVAGGELDVIAVGLNWTLNPNTRVMWNYLHADLDGAGEEDILQMRFQIDF